MMNSIKAEIELRFWLSDEGSDSGTITLSLSWAYIRQSVEIYLMSMRTLRV